MLVPVGSGVGLTTISLGLVRAMEQQGINVNFFKPVAQPLSHRSQSKEGQPESSSAMVSIGSNIKPPKSFDLNYAEQLFSEGNADVLLEQIVGRLESNIDDDQVVIVEGLVPTRHQAYTGRLNKQIASALGAEIVFVITPSDDTKEQWQDKLTIAANNYGGLHHEKVIGCIFNKVNAPNETSRDSNFLTATGDEDKLQDQLNSIASLPIFHSGSFKLLGTNPWNEDLIAPRAIDVATYLQAEIINSGDIEHRRLRSINFVARSVDNIHSHLSANTLIVTPGDRSDVLLAACLSVMNGTKIGGILLTGGYQPEPNIIKLCQQAFEAGIPVFLIKQDTWNTALLLKNFNLEVPIDDEQRIEKIKQHTAQYIESSWVDSLADRSVAPKKISPPAFRYLLTERAKKAHKTIVLPEGNDPRTIKAAAVCGERQIARTILLGDKDEILRIADHQGVELNDHVTIIEHESSISKYVAPLVEARKHKGMTEQIATEQLQDPMVLATMMLFKGEVDGIVSGAVNTTANTIRPPLQIIKTAPGSSLVSSIFFMLLPEQVLVYGDCAINPDPTAEQLADIAIQSADSAIAFGIEPKVAMISYSTGASGTGADVEKVITATKLAQTKRPDLLIDGPLQYDAAVMENVAKKKAPNSKVAGQATVFVFPDLNTGNTTYKAVQRSADVVSIGPMLQGMGKPVNDLSRGALVEDIIYTIALTAIQAAATD